MTGGATIYTVALLLFGGLTFAAGWFTGAQWEHERGEAERKALVERLRRAWK